MSRPLRDFVEQHIKNSTSLTIMIGVSDPSVLKASDIVRSTHVSELYNKIFIEGKTTLAPQDFLDIKNRTGRQYMPPAILEVSLEYKCLLKERYRATLS